ncbi:MAG TPA: GNAT family N-acetyltransferase [Acidimicrobiales bacterium]|nr:GNAT family N-acetyltransferase [Acidimicrobiales bacterium]
MTQADIPAAAVLHRSALSTEFLSRCGLAFMLTYYRARTEAPGSISLAAVDDREHVLGFILGATDPAGHVRAMLRSGLRIAARLAVYAVGHRALARELVLTRGRRYARGITRIALIKLRRPSRSSVASAASHKVGELTYLFVQPDSQGLCIGRALVEAAVETAQAAGVDGLVLVTPPQTSRRETFTSIWAGRPMAKYRARARRFLSVTGSPFSARRLRVRTGPTPAGHRQSPAEPVVVLRPGC